MVKSGGLAGTLVSTARQQERVVVAGGWMKVSLGMSAMTTAGSVGG